MSVAPIHESGTQTEIEIDEGARAALQAGQPLEDLRLTQPPRLGWLQRRRPVRARSGASRPAADPGA